MLTPSATLRWPAASALNIEMIKAIRIMKRCVCHLVAALCGSTSDCTKLVMT